MANEALHLTNGSRWVTPADLAQAPKENVLSNTDRVEARIWLAAHMATMEVLMRIYLFKLVTQGNLIPALSTVIGRKVSSKSLSSLHGADGALFWLVVTAARTVSLLGIKELTRLSDCHHILLDHHIIDSGPENESEMANEALHLTNGSRWVTPADLAQAPKENVLSNTDRVEARIWLAAHMATMEVLMRIYLFKLVTQGNLIPALSTVIGRKVSSKSLSSLHGADGALFWLVVTAARTVSLLGIKVICNRSEHLGLKEVLPRSNRPPSRLPVGALH
ncbi:hypothetical protein AHF37_08453 [Paragonimus kellicotti]|nr:hypothetical protein AHF37_08453 [Paragonimus kellicotti]